jgi:hypothetical protein
VFIFVGLPENFQDESYTPPSEVPCVIDHLCKKHDGIPLEAKGIKEYSWKTHIRKLFDTGVSVFVLKFDFIYIHKHTHTVKLSYVIKGNEYFVS